MKTKLRKVALASFFVSLIFSGSLHADTLTKASGEVLEGRIDYVNETEVAFRTSDGNYVLLERTDLDSSCDAFVESWSAEHPELTDVYATWDVKPGVLRSQNAVTPASLNAPGFQGLVSLRVILDEKGKVSDAAVSKSTHAGLEEAALDAIRRWSFKPAKIGGSEVKARIAISFKFEAS